MNAQSRVISCTREACSLVAAKRGSLARRPQHARIERPRPTWCQRAVAIAPRTFGNNSARTCSPDAPFSSGRRAARPTHPRPCRRALGPLARFRGAVNGFAATPGSGGIPAQGPTSRRLPHWAIRSSTSRLTRWWEEPPFRRTRSSCPGIDRAKQTPHSAT